ncbi:methionine aminopeptidase 1D, mitochondrial-like [Argonauta hians]
MPGFSYQLVRGMWSALKRSNIHMKRLFYASKPRHFALVTPEKVSSTLLVPAHIQRPPYVSGYGNDPHPDSIEIHSDEDVALIRKACYLARKILNETSTELKVGLTTDDIDRLVHAMCIDHGAYPSPLHYHNFPKSICTSVNNVACHGVPDSRPLVSGDIINIDITVYLNGFHGDVSETFLIGNVDSRGEQLVAATRRSLNEAIAVCRDGVPFSRIGAMVDEVATDAGFKVIPEFCGHGIGRYFHGLPDIFHVDLGCRTKMRKNMVFTIEPVLCDGSPDIKLLSDGWTAVTKDMSRSAQFEHTIRVTENGAEILTQ